MFGISDREEGLRGTALQAHANAERALHAVMFPLANGDYGKALADLQKAVNELNSLADLLRQLDQPDQG